MKKPDIVFDVDGVLLYYMTAFAEYMEVRHGIKCHVRLPCPVFHSMKNLFPGIDVRDYIVKMSVDPIFATMKSMDGAVDGLKKIADHFDIHAVSAAGNDITREYRIKNLQDVFGWKDEWPVHIVPLGARKTQHLSEFAPGTIFIDDSYEHVADARELGLNGIWFKGGVEHYLCDEHEKQARDRMKIIHGWSELLKEVSRISKISF